MRAFFFSGWCLALALAATGSPAVAAITNVTVTNASVYTAVVTVHRNGNDIGRALIHSKRHVTIGTPIDPAGGTIAIELTFNGKPVCKLKGSIAAPVTRWIATGAPAGRGMPATCALRRG
jgi:hypothetical protein